MPLGTTKIVIKSSPNAGVPPPNDFLDFGELGLNYADEILYFKNAAGNISSISKGVTETTASLVGKLKQEGDRSDNLGKIGANRLPHFLYGPDNPGQGVAAQGTHDFTGIAPTDGYTIQVGNYFFVWKNSPIGVFQIQTNSPSFPSSEANHFATAVNTASVTLGTSGMTATNVGNIVDITANSIGYAGNGGIMSGGWVPSYLGQLYRSNVSGKYYRWLGGPWEEDVQVNTENVLSVLPDALQLGSNPNILTVSGITSPAGNNPIILNLVNYASSGSGAEVLPYWSGGDWTVSKFNGQWKVVKGVFPNDYVAFKNSESKTPFGLTGWTVIYGSGQPVFSGNNKIASYIGQLGKGGSTWFRFDGQKWQEDVSGTPIVTSVTAPTDVTVGWQDPETGIISYYVGGGWVAQGVDGSGGIAQFNIDGGTPGSVYGGIPNIDGGKP